MVRKGLCHSNKHSFKIQICSFLCDEHLSLKNHRNVVFTLVPSDAIKICILPWFCSPMCCSSSLLSQPSMSCSWISSLDFCATNLFFQVRMDFICVGLSELGPRSETMTSSETMETEYVLDQEVPSLCRDECECWWRNRRVRPGWQFSLEECPHCRTPDRAELSFVSKKAW